MGEHCAQESPATAQTGGGGAQNNTKPTQGHVPHACSAVAREPELVTAPVPCKTMCPQKTQNRDPQIPASTEV